MKFRRWLRERRPSSVTIALFMSWYGKIIGAAIGLWLGGPLGPSGTVSQTTRERADTILSEAQVAFGAGGAFGTPGSARGCARPRPRTPVSRATSLSACRRVHLIRTMRG